jgi:hypothetical protein
MADGKSDYFISYSNNLHELPHTTHKVEGGTSIYVSNHVYIGTGICEDFHDIP